jgi:site-specific recombinase XerD
LYVTFRKALGERFRTNEQVLRSFCNTLGKETDVHAVGAEAVQTFLTGAGPITRAWHVKYNALRGLYRYAFSRGYVASTPLPAAVPKMPPALAPYIYSREELQRLFGATDFCKRPCHVLEPVTLRMVLVLLYGAGLRPSEALTLNLADVELPAAVLTIRHSKFYKSRLVPVGARLASGLTDYATWRKSAHPPARSDAPFFVARTGDRVLHDTLHGTFARLRTHAGIRRADGGRYQPRLHDLRHTFAVHRLLTWYRQGGDVQRLLPQLSVYLGHVCLASTQAYLTMTPALLQQAGDCFEHYVRKEGPHD